MVGTEGGEGRQGDSKRQRQQHEQQQQGPGSEAERSAGGHLRWRKAAVLSGIRLGRHLRKPEGASVQANCRKQKKIIPILHPILQIHLIRLCVCVLYLPNALYSGILHNAAGGEAKGVSQWVR